MFLTGQLVPAIFFFFSGFAMTMALPQFTFKAYFIFHLEAFSLLCDMNVTGVLYSASIAEL